MATRKRKSKQKSEVVETGLLVVKPIQTKRTIKLSTKTLISILLITAGISGLLITFRFGLLQSLPMNRQFNTAIRLDPYALVGESKNSLVYTIVDTRDLDSYRKGHIRWAIPAQDLKLDKSKKLVLYGYTQFDIKPIELARQLASKGADVQVLAVGWNEFRHFSNLWVPEKYWNSFNISDHIEESL